MQVIQVKQVKQEARVGTQARQCRQPWRRPGYLLFLGVLLAQIALLGCGSSKHTPVSGVVTFTDGTPLRAGTIEFSPANGGPVARGTIGPDGTFQLRTGNQEGALPGLYRIAIIQLASPAVAPIAAKHHHPMRRVHSRYQRFDSSKLERVVEVGKPNEFRLEVESYVPR